MILACTLGTGACGDDDAAPVTRCFVGDPSLPPEIVPIFRTIEGTIDVIDDGDRIPLIDPPQGGKVMIVGVRARNMDGCPMEIGTLIRDPGSLSIAAAEIRPISMVEVDGWLEPLFPAEIANYGNLPACPAFGAMRDINDQPWDLGVRAIDKDMRRAEVTRHITPFCAETEVLEACDCECDDDYRLGVACEPDVPDAATSDSGS